tara:strand:+ start:192 stop:632 length:441 start_codon:yes stop_codon:yes gene_type:complete
MRKVIFVTICVVIGLMMLVACKNQTIPTRNAELTVTYQGKVVKYERPTWFNESQLREELKKPGKKFLIFGAPWCGGCDSLRTALRQGNLLDKVMFVNVDQEWANTIAQFYSVKTLPTLFEIAPDTKITDAKVGPNEIVMHLLINSN